MTKAGDAILDPKSDMGSTSEEVEADLSGVSFLRTCTSGTCCTRGLSRVHACGLGDVVLTRESWGMPSDELIPEQNYIARLIH